MPSFMHELYKVSNINEKWFGVKDHKIYDIPDVSKLRRLDMSFVRNFTKRKSNTKLLL